MPSDNNPKYVSVVKGAIGGYVYMAASGSTLPTDYSTALDPAFKCIGYVSDEGITHSKSVSNTDFFDINGTLVESAAGSTTRTVKQKFIEVNEYSLKEAKGQSNVTNNAGDLSYEETDDIMAERSIVYEMVLKGGRKFRRVIPCAKVTDWGDETDLSTALGGFELTYTKYPDASGNYEYGYIEKIS